MDLLILRGLVAGWNTLPGVIPLQWSNWSNSRGNGIHLALRALATPSWRGLTVCPCHVLSSVDYLLFIKHTVVHSKLYSLYCLYLYTIQMFIREQISLFWQLQQSHDFVLQTANKLSIRLSLSRFYIHNCCFMDLLWQSKETKYWSSPSELDIGSWCSHPRHPTPPPTNFPMLDH